MLHLLKSDYTYLNDIISGKKTFEVRKNDRNYQIDDFVVFERQSDCSLYMFNICYILSDDRYVKKDYVVLGLQPCNVKILIAGTVASPIQEDFRLPFD